MYTTSTTFLLPGLLGISEGGSCGALVTGEDMKCEITVRVDVLKCTISQYSFSKLNWFKFKTKRTLIVNGVSNEEKTEDGGEDGLS